MYGVVTATSVGSVAESTFCCVFVSCLLGEIPGSLSTTGVGASAVSVLIGFGSLCKVPGATFVAESAMFFWCESDLAFICRALAVANATNKSMEMKKGRKERRTIAKPCELCTYIGYDMRILMFVIHICNASFCVFCSRECIYKTKIAS